MQVGGENIAYLDDIENGKAALAQREECYICHAGRAVHKEEGVIEMAPIGGETTLLTAPENFKPNPMRAAVVAALQRQMAEAREKI